MIRINVKSIFKKYVKNGENKNIKKKILNEFFKNEWGNIFPLSCETSHCSVHV